jgi:pyridoxal phosphate enzyme, YggS family
MTAVSENIQSVRERIDDACRRVKRVNDVELIAVTKTVDVDRIKEAIDCGIGIIGENRVQEITEKYLQMADTKVAWHMIGYLQTNKIKYIVDKVSMIESVDSLKLAQEINKHFQSCGRIIDILVEINIGGEPNKHGIDPDKTVDFITEVSQLPNLRICGLMTVAPAVEIKEYVRPYFARMREIYQEVRLKNIHNVNMKYLSMGMTGDFEIAVEEGANIVRVGSGIFGQRKY